MKNDGGFAVREVAGYVIGAVLVFVMILVVGLASGKPRGSLITYDVVLTVVVTAGSAFGRWLRRRRLER